MKKLGMSYKLAVTFIKEGRRFVAYAPALDLSTSGRTLEQAKKRFAEASRIFFEELESDGTTDEVLADLGWQRINKAWQPPLVVSQQSETVKVPA